MVLSLISGLGRSRTCVGLLWERLAGLVHKVTCSCKNALLGTGVQDVVWGTPESTGGVVFLSEVLLCWWWEGSRRGGGGGGKWYHPALLSLGNSHHSSGALLEKQTVSCVLWFHWFPALTCLCLDHWHTQSHRSVFYLWLVVDIQNSQVLKGIVRCRPTPNPGGEAWVVSSTIPSGKTIARYLYRAYNLL